MSLWVFDSFVHYLTSILKVFASPSRSLLTAVSYYIEAMMIILSLIKSKTCSEKVAAQEYYTVLNRPIKTALSCVNPVCSYISREVHIRLRHKLCCSVSGVFLVTNYQSHTFNTSINSLLRVLIFSIVFSVFLSLVKLVSTLTEYL